MTDPNSGLEAKLAFVAEARFRVRYAETDAMGIVHHSSYIVWLELARSEYCRALGLPYPEISAQGIDFLVTEVAVKYLSPSFFEDEILVRTWVSKVGRVSCRFGYQVYDLTTGKLCVAGSTEHAGVDRSGKIKRFFPELYQLLSEKVGLAPSVQSQVAR